MYRVAPLRNSLIVDERRRHPRHKPTSIIYVALGPGNGGILAQPQCWRRVPKCGREPDARSTELALNFRLQGGEQPIETVGRVAWLDPSQKGAGISFKDLPGNTERQIAAWIAIQEQPTGTHTGDKASSHVNGRAANRFRLPIQALHSCDFPFGETRDCDGRVLSRGFRDESAFGVCQRLMTFASAAPAIPPPLSSALPALTFSNSSRSTSRTAIGSAPLRFVRETLRTALRASESAGGGARDPSERLSVARPPILLRPAVVSADRLAEVAPDSFALDLRRRRKFAIGLAASMMAIIALVVTATSINKQPVTDSREVGGAQPNPPSAAVLPEKPPPTRRAAQRGPLLGRCRPQLIRPLPTPHTPVPVMRVAIGPVKQDGGLMESLRALLGMDVPNTIDPKEAALPVWTVQHSGFYYSARAARISGR